MHGTNTFLTLKTSLYIFIYIDHYLLEKHDVETLVSKDLDSECPTCRSAKYNGNDKPNEFHVQKMYKCFMFQGRKRSEVVYLCTYT